jgi:hypothetical protein
MYLSTGLDVVAKKKVRAAVGNRTPVVYLVVIQRTDLTILGHTSELLKTKYVPCIVVSSAHRNNP